MKIAADSAGAPRALLVWLTGLSGAGKTTLGLALVRALRGSGRAALLLDGDEMRRGLCADLGFSAADREENVRRLGEVARLQVDAGIFCVVAAISPFAAGRARVRERVGAERFREVFVDLPIEVAEQRDVKGLYARARRGELPAFTGISSPYEAPQDPALHLRTDSCTPGQALEQLLVLCA